MRSESLENRDIIRAAFGRQPRGVTLYIHAPGLGPNVLTYDGVRQSLLLVERVRNVTATATQRSEPERVYTYDDLCEKRTSGPSKFHGFELAAPRHLHACPTACLRSKTQSFVGMPCAASVLQNPMRMQTRLHVWYHPFWMRGTRAFPSLTQ